MTQLKLLRSRLMFLSWQKQKSKNKTRSKALQAAWAICSNEEITVHYLTRKLNNNKPLAPKTERQYSLFTH
jgi:hypothetical protein